jgi:protein gp37
MGANTKIAWTDHTWNPWYGCPDDGQRSPACDNCYARSWAKYFNAVDFDREIKRASDKTFYAPLNEKIYKPGDMVFVCSLSDFFHPEVPDKLMADAWKIIQHERPDLTWLFLTKRPKNINAGNNWPSYESITPNLWLGVTCENQKQADIRIPQLLKQRAAILFVSIEPMLGEIDIRPYLLSTYDKAAHDGQMLGTECRTDKLGWVIVGGESGPRARPMHPNWVRSLRDQCEEWSTPFFFKQWGEWATIPYQGAYHLKDVALFNVSQNGDAPIYLRDLEPERRENWDEGEPGDTFMYRVGKDRSGRMLDGREWLEMPETYKPFAKLC